MITAIMDGEPINIGELIANNIADFATGTKKDVPHLSLICWLCEDADCDLFANAPRFQFVHGEGSSQQSAYAPIHPMLLDYMFGHANWMSEVSDQEYWNRPRFRQEFTEAFCLNRRPMTGSVERFYGSEEAMDQYFDVTRGRAQKREQEIRADFAAGGARSRYHFGEDSFAEENPSTWIPEDQMED